MLLAVAAFAPFSFASSTTIPIDVQATYLITNQDPNAKPATPITLSSLGIKEGDKIQLQSVGTLSFCITSDCPQIQTSLRALFSATSDPSTALPTADGTHFPEPPTLFGNIPTDVGFVLDDFFVFASPDATTVTVPKGANFLFVIVPDSFYSDNGGNVAVTITLACGDERDDIIAEYVHLNILFYLGTSPQSSAPRCQDFTSQAHSVFYSFDNLNTGDFPSWAIINATLTRGGGAGLDAWVRLAGGAPVRPLNSVYRNPVHNSGIGGAARSRHMFGDAVDMRNITRTAQEHHVLRFAANRAKASYIEPINGPCKLGCVHADWRFLASDFVNP